MLVCHCRRLTDRDIRKLLSAGIDPRVGQACGGCTGAIRTIVAEESRTNARPETLEERVAVVADMMRALKWERGKSLKLLARDWNLSESTIKNYSAEAHRLVSAEVNNPEEVGRDVGSALRMALNSAVRDLDQDEVKSAARRDLIKAAEVWASVSGAKAAERVHLSGEVATAPPEAARLIREAFGEQAVPKEKTNAAGPDEAGNGPASDLPPGSSSS